MNSQNPAEGPRYFRLEPPIEVRLKDVNGPMESAVQKAIFQAANGVTLEVFHELTEVLGDMHGRRRPSPEAWRSIIHALAHIETIWQAQPEEERNKRA